MTRMGLSQGEQAALGKIADERAMLARTRPNAFDELRDTGRLGTGANTGRPAEVRAVNARRWATGDALRRIHARGWANPCGGVPNPLDGPEAWKARRTLDDLAYIVGEPSWRVVVRVVIAGDTLRQCHDLMPGAIHAETILLDRLSLALDRIGPLLTPST